MIEVQRLNVNSLIQLARVLMYLLVGVCIIFLPIPMFKHSHMGFKIAMGSILILYSFFRLYQFIQIKKKKNDEDVE